MASVPLMTPDAELGGKPGILDDFAYRNNVHQASLHVRMGFLRKVYGLLGVQLLITTAVAGVCMLQEDVKAFIHSNDWLLVCAFVLSFVFLVALHVKRREFPANLALLAGFTLVQAYSVGVLVTYYEQAVVLHALLLTVAVVAGLTAFTLQTKRDFSGLGVGLFMALMMLLMAGLVQMVVGSTALELAIAVGGAVVFSLFIVFDTQMLMKSLSPEEYITATITLYLDIINLFLHILRALEAARRQ
ncbi:protein lifeguard 4-like [Bacillus rossius redtenbacheri]|uniref:protein lifeguard 4-like n=1 Tax=Bacillus rossius redtenbacheri TaxID=93214 RepID=UPI002FDD3FF8